MTAEIYAGSRSVKPYISSSYDPTNKQLDNLHQDSFIHKLTHKLFTIRYLQLLLNGGKLVSPFILIGFLRYCD